MSRTIKLIRVAILAFCSFKTAAYGLQSAQSPPKDLNLDPFYTKYISANGIAVISSSQVPDEALIVVQDIVMHMLAKREDVLKEMIKNRAKIAIMSKDQVQTDIPEYQDIYTAFPGTDWNKRTRGIGATIARPLTTCAEENLLCYGQDGYRGESILAHEFGHSIYNLGISQLDAEFSERLKKAYQNAMRHKLWRKTYAASNYEEYWAEGVQDWFNCNLESFPANGIHNHINTRSELKHYDPKLYKLLEEVFAKTDWKPRLWKALRGQQEK